MKSNIVVALAAATLMAAPSLAANNEKICAATKADSVAPDTIIEACTAIIKDSNFPAGAYYNRGNAHFDKGEWALAIDDYTHTLGLNPKHANAMFNRGLAKKHLGDNAGGDADMAAAKAMQ